MDLYSVFTPRLLPKQEPFVSGFRSCPGCGQAAAVRIISKAMDDHGRHPYGISGVGLHTANLPYDQWRFSPAVKAGRASIRAAGKKVFAMAGETGTFEDGLRILKEEKNKGKPFLYICFLNEAGIERHTSASSTGYYPDSKKSFIKRLTDTLEFIDKVKAIRPEFMATASPAYPFDLIDKVKKALDCGGSSFLAVLVPCPTGCSYDPSQSLNSGRLAVETGFFPLYQIERGSFTASVSFQSVPPVSEYMKIQPLFTLLSPDESKKIQDAVDRNAKQTEKST